MLSSGSVYHENERKTIHFLGTSEIELVMCISNCVDSMVVLC